MTIPLQLRLGSQELLRLASSVSATEPGLVTGAQVAAFIREHLQNLTPQHITLDATDYNEVLRINASKGASLAIEGGDATVSLTLDCTLFIGEVTPKSSNIWIDIPICFNGGFDIFGGTPGQVLTKTKLNAVWADLPSSGSASGQSYYEISTTPSQHVTRTTLPTGWYKVDLLLYSFDGANCNAVFNPSSITAEQVINVMGMAYSGTSNGSCPYITIDGLNWRTKAGESLSYTRASSLQVSFLYHHTGVSLTWPAESMAEDGRGWSTGSFRYTAISPPKNFTPS